MMLDGLLLITDMHQFQYLSPDTPKTIVTKLVSGRNSYTHIYKKYIYIYFYRSKNETCS